MLATTLQKLAKRIPRMRRLQCFCLGAAKTGTTSFASMFAACYRSAHEPEPVPLTDAVARVLDGRPPASSVAEEPGPPASPGSLDVVAWLQERDRRLGLEVEASHPLGYMAPWLPVVFPQARFVITIRDPLVWLKSRLNFHYYKSPPEWLRYRELIWGRWHAGYHPEERCLEDLGLYSLDAYLSQYSEQYRLLFRYLPEPRRLVINTADLDASPARIGAFLGINPATIIPSHANAFSHEESIIERLPAEFVARRIEATCGWMAGKL